MEYLEGVGLTDLAAVRSMTSLSPETVLINALNCWFGSLLACPTFHADVHAGMFSLPRSRTPHPGSRMVLEPKAPIQRRC